MRPSRKGARGRRRSTRRRRTCWRHIGLQRTFVTKIVSRRFPPTTPPTPMPVCAATAPTSTGITSCCHRTGRGARQPKKTSRKKRMNRWGRYPSSPPTLKRTRRPPRACLGRQRLLMCVWPYVLLEVVFHVKLGQPPDGSTAISCPKSCGSALAVI